MSAEGGLLVGSIYAKLGAVFDPRGFREQEVAAAQAKTLAKDPIRVNTGANHNSSGFKSFISDIGLSKRAANDFDHDTLTLREHVGKLSFGIGGLAQNIVGGAAGFGLYEALRKGTERMGELEKTSASTTTVIKDTGGAAGVTAKEVEALAQSIFKKTGIDHDQVQASENVILSYRNVRNEVGAGRDVFDRATKAAADFSAATGREMKYAAEALGVALNNPEVGLTRLSRAGIVLTAQQKEQIKSMQEQGNLFGAQDLLLKTLEDRYKGQGEAVGKKLPAAFSRAKVAALDLVAAGGKSLAPTLEKIADGAASLAKHIENNTGVGHTLRVVWEGLGTAGSTVIGWLKAAAGLFGDNSKEGEIFRSVVIGLTAAVIGLKVLKDVNGLLEGFFGLLTGNPLTLILAAFAALIVYLDASGVKFKNLSQFISTVWKTVEKQAKEVFNAISHWVDEHRKDLESIGHSVVQIGEAFLHVGAAIERFAVSSGILSTIWGLIKGMAGDLLKLTADVFRFIASKEGLAILGGIIGALAGHLVALAAAWAVEKVLGFLYGIQKVTEAVKIFFIAIADNPLGAFLTVIGLVAGALIGLGSSNKTVMRSTKEYNESLKNQRDLLHELQDLDMTRAERLAALKSATIGVKEAEQRTGEIDRNPKHTKLERESAESQVEQAKLERERAKRELERTPEDVRGAKQQAVEGIEKEQHANTKLIAEIKNKIKVEKEAEDQGRGLVSKGKSLEKEGDKTFGEPIRIGGEKELANAQEKRLRLEERLKTVREKNIQIDEQTKPAIEKLNQEQAEEAKALEKAHDKREAHIEVLQREVHQLELNTGAGRGSKKVNEELTRKLEDLSKAQKENREADKEAEAGLKNFAHSAESAGGAATEAASQTEGALNVALKALGVKPVNFGTSGAKELGEAKTKHMRAAQGGVIGWPGAHGQDDKLILAADGEGIINRHQMPHVEWAMNMAHALTGEGFPSLDDMWSNVTTPHSYASGGAVGGTRLNAIEKEADRINALHLKYDWGGGHGTTPAPPNGPFDCSSAVSRVLQGAGYKVPTDTTPALISDWHFPTGPGPAVIYARGGKEAHTFMRIGNRYWGTSGFGHPGFTGPGWFTVPPDSSYLSQFTEMHPPGLGGKADEIFGGSIKEPKISGPTSGFKSLGQAASKQVAKAANAYLARAQPPSTGGANALNDGGPGRLSTGQEKSLLGQALAIAGVRKETGAWDSMLLRQIEHESSGRTNPPPPHDVNWPNNPSMGILQVTGSNFRQYAVPPYNKNIVDPLSNMIASIKYIIAVWGHGNQQEGLARMIANGGKAYSKAGRIGPKPKAKAATHKTSSRKHRTDKATKPPTIPSWLKLSKADKESVGSLENTDEKIGQGDVVYNRLVDQFNRENTRAGGTIPETQFNQQQRELKEAKEAIVNDLHVETGDVKSLREHFDAEAGADSPRHKNYVRLQKDAAGDRKTLGKLEGELTKLTKKAREATTSAQKRSLQKRLHEYETENGTHKESAATAHEEVRYDEQGNKIKTSKAKKTSKPIDRSKEISRTRESLKKLEGTDKSKDAEAAVKEQIKNLKKKLTGENREEKKLKKELDAFKELAAKWQTKEKELPQEIETAENEKEELTTTEVTTDRADEEDALQELTPEQQKEQDLLEYELSRAEAGGGGNAGLEAAAELPIEQKMLALAQRILQYREGQVGNPATATPAGLQALKGAQEGVNSVSQQITQLTEAAPGGAQNPDTQAQLTQGEEARNRLELLNQQSQQEIQALTGSGDIGSGYRSAFGAASSPGQFGAPVGGPFGASSATGGGPTIYAPITVASSSFHPSDPSVMRDIGDVTAAALQTQLITPATQAKVL